MEEFKVISDEYNLIEILKKNELYCLLEVKEKSNDELKYVKMYYKEKINEGNICKFVELVEKEKELKLNNILTYDKTVLKDKYFILVMKKYKSNVEEKLKNGEIKESEINKIMLKLVERIKKLQENGIIYNNIKLSNLLLDNDGEITIVDNLEYLLKKENEVDVKEIIYSSPEVLRNEETTINSDIWNIGVVYYKLLTKETPFKTESKYDLIKSLIDFQYNPNASLSEKYNDLLSKMLIVKKQNRLTIDEIIQSIKEIEFERMMNEIKELLKKNENEKVNEIVNEMKENNSLEENYKMNKMIGDYYYENKEWKEAITYLRISLEYSSSPEERLYCNNHIGDCYYNIKEYREAIHYFRIALMLSSLDKDKEMNNRNIGDCYFDLNHYETALTYFKIALEYSSSDKNEEMNNGYIGDCYFNLKDYQKAIPFYTEALEYSSSDEDKLFNSMYFGCCYHYLKQQQQAISLFNSVLEYCTTDHDLYSIYNYMGKCYYYMKEYEEGLKYHQNSLEHAKKDSEISLELGNIADCYLMLGNEEEYFNYINQVEEEKCDNDAKAELYMVKGIYHFKKNEKDRSKEYLENALIFFKDSDNDLAVEQITSYLEELKAMN